MMRLLIVAAMMMLAPICAQALTLTVEETEIGVIGEALGSMPYAKVAPLVTKLNTQIRDQVKPPAAPAPQKEPEKK
jgi:hypothetical protein